MYSGIIGTEVTITGTAGTVTIPSGAAVLQFWAEETGSGGPGTVVMFGGASIILPTDPLPFRFMHRLNTAPGAPHNTIVFTNTKSFFVEYVKSGNT
jgi:hypothetical protein